MPTPPTTITVREFTSLADYDACVALQDATWGAGFSERVPGAILRVSQKIGGVSAGAFADDGRLLGFVFGMTGLKDGALVHWSDMLAVTPEARGHNLGERLKQYQRDAVRALGVATMYWTADPLVARNAHFNINRLGAFPSDYVENMYGANTGSVLHGAMPTDRAVYRWDLVAGQSGTHTGEPLAGDDVIPGAITIAADGTPSAVSGERARIVRVHVPHDLTVVQAESMARAREWRLAVRAAFTARLGRGFTVSRFVRGNDSALPYYVLTAGH